MTRRNLKTMLLIVLSLLFTACGKQQKAENAAADRGKEKTTIRNKKKNKKPKSAETKEAQEVTADEEQVTIPPSVNYATASLRDYEGGAIANIRKSWRYRPIEESWNQNIKSPGIELFAYSFISGGPSTIDFPPHRAIDYYICEPEELDTDHFSVNCSPKNGYIRSDALTQFDLYSEMCYWKRPNGHCLFGVFLAEEHEIPSKNDQITLFYDYDPDKKMMTPEPEITDMIEQKMQPFDKYRAHMPEKGKDIRISAYEVNYEEDSAEETVFLLKWDGNAFKWAK